MADQREVGGADSRGGRLAALLHEARIRLIETGTRNRLVHVNRKAKRPATLAIVGADVETAFERLVRSQATFRFAADPAATDRERRSAKDGDDHDEVELVADDARQISTDVTPRDVFQTRLGESGLQKRLTKFAREAKTLEEEQGINILYLAIGFLRWFEDENSQVAREAPLILVPVTLKPDIRRSTYTLTVREDDISTNLPLAERLRDQEGLTLPEISDGDDWRPADYFEAVAEAVGSRERWTIDRNGIELGFFSFAKLLMFRDLSPDAWPQATILEHPLLRALMQEGFAAEEPLFPSDTKLDALFKPEDLKHVLDADSSQTLAIETTRAGRNLVIHGPPGTGKSQTIANVIASAAHDGRTVLFIAEKMVALEVVHRRLRDAGLGPLCLELHSRAANKRTVAEELARTLNGSVAEPFVAVVTEQLTNARDTLNYAADDLHTPIGHSALTPFEAVGALARAKGLGIRPPSVSFPGADGWTPAEFDEVVTSAEILAAMSQERGPVAVHPWRGVGNESLQPTEIDRLGVQLQATTSLLRSLLERLDVLASLLPHADAKCLARAEQIETFLGYLADAPRDHLEILSHLQSFRVERLREIDELFRIVRQLIEEIGEEIGAFRDAGLAADPMSIRTRLVGGTVSFFKRWGSAYRGASAELASWLTTPLPRTAQERVAVVDSLLKLQSKLARRQTATAEVQDALGSHWRGEKTNFDGLNRAFEWVLSVRDAGFDHDLSNGLALVGDPAVLGRHHEALQIETAESQSQLTTVHQSLGLRLADAFGEENKCNVDLARLINHLEELAGNLDRYEEWRKLSRAYAALRAQSLDDFANDLARGSITSTQATENLRYARAEQLWTVALRGSPRLAALQTFDRGRVAASFAQLDKAQRKTMAAMIRARHAKAVPRGAFGDMGIIRGEIARKRGHMPLRKLMGRVGRTIQQIKPVMLMSPISVAQFLPPGSVEFDMLVIDEASQVRPEDALGVIGRAKQIVVVGDAKQLPPTNFFMRLLSDEVTDTDNEEEENDGSPDALAGAAKVAELESILTLCEARGVSSRLLKWHYRSKHPSLIEVSNREFYQDLFLPPSPAATREVDGFVLKRVDGAYDRGGKRTNEIEAKAIVDALVAHAGDYLDRSIGIVTFSTAQRDLVANLVENARRHSPVLDSFLNDQVEETFVKNLENVQGDERDHILVSVGYGPRTSGGRLDSANFGPVSKDGGERRLNVLFTRARYRCEVFCSFDPHDIDTERALSRGADVLKRYLVYAATGILDTPHVTGDDAGSPFEEDVQRVIHSLGYIADLQVGSVGFKIDIGVRAPSNPGRYILAVECDGATYHGALWARERDRLRQEILEGQGWKFHRIWSTDWFYRRDAEIRRLRGALVTAASAQVAPKARPTESSAPVYAATEGPAKITPLDGTGTPYATARVEFTGNVEPHDLPPANMGPIVQKVIDQEGPIHTEEVARRIAEAFGKDRAGSRIQDAAQRGLAHLLKTNRAYKSVGDFWFTEMQANNPPIRDRSTAPPSLLRPAMLPPLEIQAAIIKALANNGGISYSDLAVAVTRQFGFLRTGAELRATINAQVDDMIVAERLVVEGDIVRQRT